MGHWRLLLILVVALVALSIAIYRGGDRAEAELAHVPNRLRAIGSAAAESAGVPEVPHDHVESRTEAPLRVAPEAVRSPNDGLTLNSVSELAALLKLEDFNRASWVRAARALSASLNETHGEELAALLEGSTLGLPECVAAAELLRLLKQNELTWRSSLFCPETLHRLRVAQTDRSRGSIAVVAARVLAGGGEWADAYQLADDLVWSDAEQLRSDAAWCLEANHRPAVAQYLADSLFLAERADGAERVLAVLVAMQSSKTTELLDELSCSQLLQVAKAALETGSPERVRAITHYINQLDPGGASTLLLEQLDTADALQRVRDVSRFVALSEDRGSLQALRDKLRSEVDPDRRLALAEGLLVSSGTHSMPPEFEEEALHIVINSALESSSSTTRRRSIGALSAVPDERSADALLRVLRSDSDPRVRSAAAYALSDLPAEMLTALRTEIEELDESAESTQKALSHLRRRAFRD